VLSPDYHWPKQHRKICASCKLCSSPSYQSQFNLVVPDRPGSTATSTHPVPLKLEAPVLDSDTTRVLPRGSRQLNLQAPEFWKQTYVGRHLQALLLTPLSSPHPHSHCLPFDVYSSAQQTFTSSQIVGPRTTRSQYTSVDLYSIHFALHDASVT